MECTVELATILVIEDCLPDVELLRYMFSEAKICNAIEVIDNGQEALDRLLLKKEYAQASLPDIVFLDLNLPGLGGIQILNILKDRYGDTLPIILLTGCDAERQMGIEMGASPDCFMLKPLTMPALSKAISAIKSLYWGIVSEPKEDTTQALAS